MKRRETLAQVKQDLDAYILGLQSDPEVSDEEAFIASGLEENFREIFGNGRKFNGETLEEGVEAGTFDLRKA